MIENTILSSLVFDDVFVRKTLPYIKREYFKTVGEQIVFTLINEHFLKYNKSPTFDTLKVELENRNLIEHAYNGAKEVISEIKIPKDIDFDWLVDSTEDFCKKRAFYNAMLTASDLINKDDTTLYNSMLDVVKDALGVSFDTNIGQDFLEDSDERFMRYHSKQDKLESGIRIFNTVTKGGFVNKSLIVFVAPTGVGKSTFLCSFAADFLKQGKNVLYISMEMAEDEVAKRIDANVLDLTTQDLMGIEINGFRNRIQNVKKSTNGKLIIKDYPSGQAHSGHFRHLITELKLKKDFQPDVIIVDYLNICSSARVSANAGLYSFNKMIAEELRGLGQEFNSRVFTATQTTRDGARTSDFGITDTSESWGVPATADYMYGAIETPELAALGQMKIKRLKDRYNDYITWYPSFIVGVDKKKQRVFDIEDHPMDDTPVFDQTSFEKNRFSSFV